MFVGTLSDDDAVSDADGTEESVVAGTEVVFVGTSDAGSEVGLAGAELGAELGTELGTDEGS